MTIESIYHFEQVTPRIGASGQPTNEQFESIAQAGYDAVINLALADSDRAIDHEGSLVTALGMSYHHIPVKFDAPSLADLQLFLGVMRALKDRRVWVHCVVNARGSAFLYHYLRLEEGCSDDAARTELMKKWAPQMDAVWQAFMALSPAELHA